MHKSHSTFKPKRKAIVIRPSLKIDVKKVNNAAKLQEAIGLGHAIELDIIHSEIILLNNIRPSSFIGKGKIEELKPIIQQYDVEVVIFDDKLSPIQQRNLEKALQSKVIDRTALILEIFGERARTKEGKLQVELAALEYQKSRLVRSWTHLERQRGGLGFVGGPGETQIEADRRIILEKITKLKNQLKKVVQTRTLHRKSRKDVPFPIVALVGYTNAGKSTLFNLLTKSKVMAEDMLFATLDPTMRILELPSKRKVILSDTVGFISELPTELVAAFKATLEEVVEADLILHVRDISADDSEEQKIDVLKILESIIDEDKINNSIFEIHNKIDLIEGEGLKDSAKKIGVSALTGYNQDKLLLAIDKFFGKTDLTKKITLKCHEGKIISWLYENAIILMKEECDELVKFDINISHDNFLKLTKMMKEK